MLLAVAVFLLLASGAPAASAPSPRVSVVVLRDGTRYMLSRPYEVKGSQARLSLTTGQLVAVRASEIDEEASKRATEAANAPPTPTPAPTPKPTARSIVMTGDGRSSSRIPDDPSLYEPPPRNLVIPQASSSASTTPPRAPGSVAPTAIPYAAPTHPTVYTGPRGGQYHYSESGKKVYEKKSTPAPKK